MITVTLSMEEYESILQAQKELDKLPVLGLFNNEIFGHRVYYIRENEVATELHKVFAKLAHTKNLLEEKEQEIINLRHNYNKIRAMSVLEFINFKRKCRK